MCVRCLGFVLLLWFPGVPHVQSANQWCPAPRLDEGYFVPKQDKYDHGTTLSYACDKGHKPAVEGWWATSKCENGIWSHQPLCINEKACIHPVIPDAAHSDDASSWYEEGKEIIIECDDGYESNATRVTCVNGTWNSTLVCDKSPDACGEPPEIPHAVINDQGPKEVFAAGSKVEYECEKGFIANTPKAIICSSGNWSEVPQCRSPTSSGSNDGGNGQHSATRSPTSSGSNDGGSGHNFGTIDKCGKIPVVRNGEVVHTDVRSLIYQCGRYYKLVGEATVVCYRDGTWSDVPTCKAAFCTVDTNAHPELKPVGVKYIIDGGSERLRCTDVWLFENFSVAQCTDGQVELSRCCNRLQLGTRC